MTERTVTAEDLVPGRTVALVVGDERTDYVVGEHEPLGRLFVPANSITDPDAPIRFAGAAR